VCGHFDEGAGEDIVIRSQNDTDVELLHEKGVNTDIDKHVKMRERTTVWTITYVTSRDILACISSFLGKVS
jgi:hypothetical protein